MALVLCHSSSVIPKGGIEMAQYILFVRGGGGSSTELTPAESEALRAPYAAWAGKLGQEGRLVNADEVDENFYRLTRPNGRVVTEGPLTPEPNAIGGYFIFRADS